MRPRVTVKAHNRNIRAAPWLRALVFACTLASTCSLAADAPTLPDVINAGDRAGALQAINSGADVNQASMDGTTALHWAVYREDLELVRLLLARSADPDRRNDYGATPMTVASEHGSFPVLQALVEAGGDIESPNAEGQTLLMAVARTGNVNSAGLLLERGARVDTRETWGGQTALMWAAAQRQPAMVRLLLEHGADANARGKDHDWPRWVTSEPRVKPLDPGGYTPLLYAAREGCVDCVAALLDGGADIDLPDLWGQTPLLMATLNLHYDSAALLIERGADIQRWDWWGRTALYNTIDLHLMTSSSRGDLPSTDRLDALDVARLLLERGARVNPRLKHEPPFRGGDRGYTDGSPDSRVLSAGATALHKAAKAADLEALRLLLEYGARVDVRNHLFEVTPLLAAAGVWRVYGIFREVPISGEYTTGAQVLEAVKLLQAAGADIHARAANGQNAAHGAAKAGWIEVLQWAADQGIDLHARDVGGLTPREVAQITGQTEAIAFLDRVAGNPPDITRPALPLPVEWSTQDAILAFLPAGLDATTATADDLAQAATDLAFAMEGDIETNLRTVMVALGEMTRAGRFTNAPRHGEYSPEGRFYTKVMNLASSNLDVVSTTYYGLTVQDMTRLAAALREGSNILNGARSNAITRPL